MKKLLKLILGNTFTQGSLFLTFSTFIVYISNYIFNFLIGHYLGPVGFGEITSLFSYQYISMVPILVLTTIIIQKIGGSENPYSTCKDVEYLFWNKIKKWWWIGLIGAVILPFLPNLTNLSPLVSLSLFPLFILGFFTSFYTGALQGLHLFFAFSAIAIIAAFVKLLGAVAVAFNIDGITIIIVFLLTSSLYTCIASYRKYKHVVHKKNPHTKSSLNYSLIALIKNRHTYYTLFSVLSLTFFNNADVIFVKKYFSAFDSGIYNAWSLFAKIIWYVLTPLLLISFIYFSNKKKYIYHSKIFIGVLLFICIVGILSYVGYTFLSPWLSLFLLGEKFITVNPYLSKAALFGTFYSIIVFINNYFLARKNPMVLLMPILVILYCSMLFTLKKSIPSIVQFNLTFSFIAVIIHIGAYIQQSLKQTS
ncbi:MAG TPA: hypothetical protein VJB63_01620 [Patescibacteria group bacterium]|nr:hypothetical protein [Patescibacteria group bacterium]